MRRIILILIASISLLLIPISQEETRADGSVHSGWCGENVTWSLNEVGVLTISGQGAMENYSNGGKIEQSPWGAWDTEIKSVIIESGVTSVGSASFYSGSVADYKNIKSVIIPESITTIGDYSFYKCSGITTINIPKNVSTISDNAFFGCIGLADEKGFVIINNNLFYYNGTDSEVFIPHGVTSIGSGAFRYCEYLSSITIPEGVTRVGNTAFADCDNLKNVVLPNSVTDLGNNVFYNSKNITSITMPVLCESLDRLFGNGSVPSSLATVTLSKGSIPDNYCAKCTGLKSVILLDRVTSIGSGAFKQCSSLMTIDIPESVTRIGYSAFAECSKLSGVTIPEGVSFIGSETFYGCSNLTSITIPERMKSIGDRAFYGCISLSSVMIPGSVTVIGNYVFAGCSNLNEIIVSENNTAFCDINGVLFDKDKKMVLACPGNREVFEIPEGVTSICEGAFFECRLSSVVLPHSITSIGDSAFENSGLIHVTLMGGLTDIGENVFRACSSLVNVTLEPGIKYIGKGMFWSCTNLERIEIPVSVSIIRPYSFVVCDKLKDVYYGGSEEQWKLINIGPAGTGTDCLTAATIHYNSVTAISYTITYNANGGSNPPPSQTKYKDVDLSLSLIQPTSESSIPGQYSIELNINDGSNIVFSQSAETATEQIFVAWNTKIDGGGATYYPGSYYTINQDVTLYAQWKPYVTVEPIILPNITRKGYIFKGWGTSSNAVTGIKGSYIPTKNETLFAIWQGPDFILPAMSTVIESDAFLGCDFTFVKLSNKTKIIRERAFANCYNMEYIYIPNSVESIAPNAFEGITSFTILGESGSIAEAYALNHGFNFAVSP